MTVISAKNVMKDINMMTSRKNVWSIVRKMNICKRRNAFNFATMTIQIYKIAGFVRNFHLVFIIM